MFLRNSWYCAGWSGDIDEAPVGRTFLGDYVVLFRTEDGVAHALAGRCPHRFAPMDQGKVCGQTIACPYHGLVFDADGACIKNPHAPIIPPRATLRAYPLLERHGVLWIWMGDPALADKEMLPDDSWLVSPNFSDSRLYFKVDGNYQLVSDNLLDLTHGPYLHAATLSGVPHPERTFDHSVRTEGHEVWSNYSGTFINKSAAFKNIFKPDFGDLIASMVWRPGSTLTLDITMRSEEASADARFLQGHYLTPETEFTTHYWAAIGRDVDVENTAEDEYEMRLFVQAFTEEDEPMIRMCQQLMGTSDLMSLQPAILKSDAAAVQARRILAQLIKREQPTQATHD